MTLSLKESQAFLTKQSELWQSHSIGLGETCQDLQGLRDEEAQAVVQLEAEKAVNFLQKQLALWTNVARGQLVSAPNACQTPMQLIITDLLKHSNFATGC